MKTTYLLITVLLTFSLDSHAQFRDCSPTAVLKSGVKGIYSDDSLVYIKTLQGRLPIGAVVSPDLAANIAREHKNCVRLRRTQAERDIFEVKDQYKQNQLERSFGAWTVNNGLLAVGALVGASQGSKVLSIFEKTLVSLGVSSSLIGIDIGQSIVDISMESPGAYLNRITSIAYAEARVAGTEITPESISTRLEELLRSEESPAKVDEGMIDAVRNAAHAKFREMLANAPKGKEEEWFRDTMFTTLGFKPGTSIDDLRDFAKRPLTAEQKKQSRELRDKHKAAREKALNAQRSAVALLKDAEGIGQSAKEKVSKDPETEKIGQQILASLDPAIVSNPTALKNALSAMAPVCTTATVCAAINQQVKNAEFREDAQKFSSKAENVRLVAATAVKALSLAGADPKVIRDISALSTASDSAAKIAARIAGASTLGPMGWVAVAGDLLDLGGTLGGMFGGSSGPSAEVEMNKRVMEALAAISRQIEDLRIEIRDQFADNRKQLALLELYSKLTSELAIDAAENSGLGQCLKVASAANKASVTTGRAALEYVLAGNDNAKLLAAQCHEWFLNQPNGGFNISNSGVSVLFTSKFQDIKVAGSSDSNPAARDAFLEKLNQDTEGFARLIRLTRYSLSWHANKGSRPVDLGALVHSPSNFRELQMALDSLSNTATSALKPSNLATLVRGLGGSLGEQDVNPSVRDVGSFHDMLRRRLDTDRVSTILSAGLLIRQLQPYLEPIRDGGVLSVQFSDPTSDESFMRRATPMWMWDASVLAYLVKVQQTLYRGDYALPLIDTLLRDAEKIENCKPAPLVDTGTTLCARFGSDVLRTLTEDARIVIGMFPELRANVAAWRVRQALSGLKTGENPVLVTFRETDVGMGFHPVYGQAIDQNTSRQLGKLLPREIVYRMNTDYKDNEGYERYAQDSERNAKWFIKLSGSCSGLDRAALNARISCANGKCEGTEIKKSSFGDWLLITSSVNLLPPTDPTTTENDLKKWRNNIELNCVLAPVPTRSMLEEGRFWSPMDHEPLMVIADQFIIAASREINRHHALTTLVTSPNEIPQQVRNELIGSIFYALKPTPVTNVIRP